MRTTILFIAVVLLGLVDFSIHMYSEYLEEKIEKHYEFERITELNITSDSLTPTGIYIPKDLEDCHSELDRMLHPKAKKYLAGQLTGLSKEEEYKYQQSFGHMGLGMWIRNNWGLWHGDKSRLYSYFKKRGLFHPDDMSSIILASYRAKLQKRKYDMEGDIGFYKKFWKLMKKMPDLQVLKQEKRKGS